VDAIWDNTAGWLQDVGKGLLDIAVALLTAAVYIGFGALLGRYASGHVARLLSSRSFGRNGALMIGRLISVVFILVSILMLFGRLGANWTGLLTFVSASAVAVSLSIQDVLRNLVAGIYLLLERPFRVGDRIRVRDVMGEVQGIDIRTTLVRNDDGELVLVPNAIVFTEVLANRSHYRVRRLDFTISNLTQSIHDVEKAVANALRDVKGVRQPIPAPHVTGSGPDGRTMTLRLMVDKDPAREAEVIEHVLNGLGDARVEVSRS
jgi:small-conductance mechanosensitive channel